VCEETDEKIDKLDKLVVLRAWTGRSLVN